MNKVEQWKQARHGLDVWPRLVQLAADRTPLAAIDEPDLEQMKWYGTFSRKRDGAGTYMLRIRVTSGELTPLQARAVAHLAQQFGYGIVDITTRSNLQVQGLNLADVPRALASLEAVGLSTRQTGHDNVRNVYGHPLAGLDPGELLDTRPLCRAITDLVLDDRRFSDLPRKFNIALSGREEHALHYWTQDLSFLACRGPDDRVGFQVLIGGTQGQSPCLAWQLPVLVQPDEVVAVTIALLDLFRQQGSREKRDQARFRYLIEKIGVDGVLAWLAEQVPRPLLPSGLPVLTPGGYEQAAGWFRQRQAGLWALGLCVPLGRLTWQQLEALAVSAGRWSTGTLRTTPEQGLLLTGIPTGFRDAIATDAAACGLSPLADSLLLQTVACTGKQFCNIAVTETKGHMLQLIDRLRQRSITLHGVRIHMSGCPSSCALHHTADIGLKGVRVRRLVGTREGFDVYLGGGIAGQVHLGLIYRLGVDVDQLPQLIEDVLSEFYLRRQAGQSFSAYWRETLRDRQASKVGEHDYQRPTWLCERCGHHHLGEDPPIYCPKCAGLRRYFARLADDELVDYPLPSSPAPEVVPPG
jgi:ferredoxin-nitrite reductase